MGRVDIRLWMGYADTCTGRSTNSDRFHGEIDGETTFLYVLLRLGRVSC